MNISSQKSTVVPDIKITPGQLKDKKVSALIFIRRMKVINLPQQMLRLPQRTFLPS